MQPTPWYKSKTLWFNILSFILFLAQFVTDPENAIHLSPAAMKIFGTVVAVGNYLLRYFSTHKPIEGSPKDPAK